MTRADDATLYVGADSYPGRLNTPDGPSEWGILVIPGARHGPFGDVFDRFADAAVASGHSVARFETWQNRDELGEKTEAEFHDKIDAGVDFLRTRGHTPIAVVAKSFGGRLALTHDHDGVDRMVLWAPAILFGEHEGSRSITPSALGDVDVPTRILQGDEDRVVSVENAANIAEHLPHGELVELPGEDHSFSENEALIVERTLAFLSD